MVMNYLSIVLLAVLVFAGLCNSQIQLFTEDTSFENVLSSTCIKALSTTIDCHSTFVYYPGYDHQGPFEDSTALDQFCSPTCTSSLSSYHRSVEISCKGQPDPYDGIPSVYGGDRLWAYQSRTCLKDPQTGQYCNGIIANWSTTLPEYDITIDQIPKQYLCSDCYLALLQAIQKTPYSNYDENMVDAYGKAQQICGVRLQTEVQPWPANATVYRPAGTGTSYNASTDRPCLSGSTVTVQSGDTCQGLSQANGVSTGALRILNGIFPDCGNLIAGTSLCLPQRCSTYNVRSGDTCVAIASTYGLRISDLTAYNPTLNRECTNLVVGDTLCLSPPAGHYTATVIRGATVTQTGLFATATAASPGPKACESTTKCGKWYQCQSGDTCQQISLAQSNAPSLFAQINPSINDQCSNLSPGLYYCVHPTHDWSANTTDTAPQTAQVLSDVS